VTALIGGPFTADESQEKLRTEIASMTAYNVQYWPILLLQDDRHVGCAGLRPYRLDEQIYDRISPAAGVLGTSISPLKW
jgi:ribosomal-protein-alanine N-acetyltransferase